jgi:putative transposase
VGLCARAWKRSFEFRIERGLEGKCGEEVVDELLENYQKPEDILGEDGLLKQLTKALLERALNAELTTHLGYKKHEPAGYGSGNTRNGKSKKTLKGDFGELDLAIPRDRQSTFEPQIVAKGQTRFSGFDQKILALYSGGMTVRDIQAQLEEMYGVECESDSSRT